MLDWLRGDSSQKKDSFRIPEVYETFARDDGLTSVLFWQLQPPILKGWSSSFKSYCFDDFSLEWHPLFTKRLTLHWKKFPCCFHRNYHTLLIWSHDFIRFCDRIWSKLKIHIETTATGAEWVNSGTKVQFLLFNYTRKQVQSYIKLIKSWVFHLPVSSAFLV